MIKNLNYTVTFPTGRTLSNTLDFSKGLTAICGPNESGKTFVIEVIRWCLFGSKALRGSADDYKNLSATMTFNVRGLDYTVTRKADNAKLSRDGETIAVGTRPVNMKIITILGYTLEVFDVAHVANQGDVTRLGDMLPAERKRMVDQVIGLDRVDELNKWVGDQGTALRQELEILERLCGAEPVAPEAPEGYQPSVDLTVAIAAVRERKTEYDQLKGWLSQVRQKPSPADRPPGVRSELEAAIQQIKDRDAERKRILALPTCDYDPEAVRVQWAAYDLWQARVAFEKANPSPILDRKAVEAAFACHEAHDERERLEKQKEVLEKSGTATCPSCSTTFCLAHDALQPIYNRLVYVFTDPRPDVTPAALKDELHRLDNWARPETIARWEELKLATATEKPLHGRQAPAGAISTAERDRLLLPALTGLQALEQALRDLQAYEVAQAVYEREIGPYEVWVAERAVKQARVVELEAIVATLPDLEKAHKESVAYEHSVLRHTSDHAAWVVRREEITSKMAEAVGWKDAKAFLVELRVRIKSYLTPSLSKVASHLLTQMTGGERTSIIVDPDFEITVDGQKLATLSGSGKACANLALRIGLGQVLTNSVLSLFIGDEIDASMDEDRAENTHLSLRKMTNSVSQILLITHKVPSADHTVVFEGAKNAGRIDTRGTSADGREYLEGRALTGA